MSETETATNQPDAGDSGEVETSSEPYVPSFMRDDEPEPESEETPEPQTEDGEGESEADSEASVEESVPIEDGETPQPSQDEFLASLTPEENAYYAKRYPTLYKAYQDPNQPADLRQAFIDRVNQDHAYAELRDGQNQEEEEEEPTPEPVQPADQAEQRKQYYQQIDEIVSKQIDPQAVNEMGSQLLAAMGVDLKSQDPEIQAIVKNAPRVGHVLARGAVDLMATVLPHLLPTRMEAAMPQITEMYYDNLRARTWEQMRNQTVKGPDGVPTKPYAKLPAMGTPQWDAAIDKVLGQMPELREMFTNLPPQERFKRQYAVAAKLLTGQQVNPALVAKAVETGKKQARQADVGRAARKVLGAGKATGEARSSASGNEDIFGPGIEEYKRRGG